MAGSGIELASRDPLAQRFLSRLQRRPCYGGLDLGAVSDLTAFVLAWPIRNFVYVHPWAWIPSEGIAERSKRDNVGYADWAKRGLIELTPGSVTDWRFVTERIKQLGQAFRIQQIGYDRYGARDTASDLTEAGFKVVDCGQGFVGMNAPCRRIEELVLSRHMVHSGHEVMRWCLDCSTTEQDAAGNIKLTKPERKKSSKRIDITVAMAMAIDCVMKRPEIPNNGFFVM